MKTEIQYRTANDILEYVIGILKRKVENNIATAITVTAVTIKGTNP
jgi:hypothetical protein